MTPNFHYAAYSYLDEYLSVDRDFIAALQDGARDETEVCCQRLTEMAIYYRIVRNLSPKHCEEKMRLLPVLEELNKMERPTSADDAVSSVQKFISALKERYGRELTSAASKFLWMRFQSPIVIYDSLAHKALTNLEGIHRYAEYPEYFGAWREAYRRVESDVELACRGLPQIKQFTLAEDMDEEQLDRLVEMEWFRERAFDHWLVSHGSRGTE